MIDDYTKKVLSKPQREANVKELLNRFDSEKHDFNTILLAFVDTIQSSFYNLSKSNCKTEGELRRVNNKINRTVTEILSLLNESGMDNAQDMVAVSTVMIEMINRAMLYQEASGTKVKPDLS